MYGIMAASPNRSRPMPPRPHLVLYKGPDCCLCDRALALIEKVARDVPFELELCDITSDAALYERFRTTIPAIAIDGRVVMEGKVSEFWLRRALGGEPPDRFRVL